MYAYSTGILTIFVTCDLRNEKKRKEKKKKLWCETRKNGLELPPRIDCKRSYNIFSWPSSHLSCLHSWVWFLGIFIFIISITIAATAIIININGKKETVPPAAIVEIVFYTNISSITFCMLNRLSTLSYVMHINEEYI